MMWKHWTIFALGILVLANPFLGFPSRWDTAFLFLSGGVIAFLAYLNARGAYESRSKEALGQEPPASFRPKAVRKATREVRRTTVTEEVNEENLGE